MPKEKKAKRGEGIIEVSIPYWTNDIAKTKGYVVPKRCRFSGPVPLPANQLHGIRSGEAYNFNPLMELTAVIGRAMAQSWIRMHTVDKSGLYVVGK